MAVKVMIKRRVPEELEKELARLLKEIRAETVNRNGYISGETFTRYDEPGESLVISTWQSVEDWQKWYLSPERQRLQGKIDALLGRDTGYEIYEYTRD